MKIGTYFDDYEFACKCGRHGYDSDGHPILDHIIDKRLVDVLDAIRERIGKPIEVLSGYRCPIHNEEVGGVPNSQHVEGTAADITYDGINVDYLAEVAEECGADALGDIIIKILFMLMCEAGPLVGQTKINIGGV